MILIVRKEESAGLSLFYPAYDARRNEIKFRALPFEDYTKTPVDDSSLYINGPVVFEAPDNWVKVKHNTSTLVWPDGVLQVCINHRLDI